MNIKSQFQIFRPHHRIKCDDGGIVQLGAQVTSKTTPNLSKKLAKFPLDIFGNLFYNQRGLVENQRFHTGKVTGEFHMGV